MSRTERLARIAELLTKRRITSQAQLREALAKEGSAVTQATLSRDLELLQAQKDDSGRYWVPDPSTGAPVTKDSLRLSRTLAELCASVAASGNSVVLRTPPGAAAYLASAIDRGGLAGTIGTIAGDDTVLVISDTANGGAALAKRIDELRHGKAENR